MKKVLSSVDGYKTYFVCLLSVLWAGYGVYSGFISYDVGTSMVQMALIGSGIRHAVSKK